MNKSSRLNMIYLALALGGILALQYVWSSYAQVEPVAYSQFMEMLEEGRVRDLVIDSRQIRGRFLTEEELQAEADGAATEQGEEPKGKRFVTTRVDPELSQILDKYNVRYTQALESDFLNSVLSWLLPILLFAGLWFFLIRRMAARMGPGGQGGLMAIGKSKAKVFVETDIKTTFEDVAGVDEAKEELQETVSFLKDPASYGRLGARMPKGVLLVGPPGTGKTLLARAVAGEAAVPFFFISGSEFVEMFVGVGAARVRDLFEQARGRAPCIIFIDELDALGRARTSTQGFGGHDEKEQTLNQLLVELDGFDPSNGIVLLAATNRPETLDPALLRAGRFDRQVLVDRPDKVGRAQILKVHIKRIKLAPDVHIEQVASLTPGFTGADLANLVNEAALVATRLDAKAVEMRHFTMAIERIVAGLEKKNRLLNEKERKVVAHHEMGHALVAAALPGVDPVHKISIIPRGVAALGYTIQRPTEDRYLMTKEELSNKMTVLFGGRVAEKIIFDHLSTGAADDMAKATDIARSMAMRYGMIEPLGHVSWDEEKTGYVGPVPRYGPREFSDQTARHIDEAIKGLMDQAYQRAHAILTVNRELLEEGAEQLLQKETLEKEQLEELLSRAVAPKDREAA